MLRHTRNETSLHIYAHNLFHVSLILILLFVLKIFCISILLTFPFHSYSYSQFFAYLSTLIPEFPTVSLTHTHISSNTAILTSNSYPYSNKIHSHTGRSLRPILKQPQQSYSTPYIKHVLKILYLGPGLLYTSFCGLYSDGCLLFQLQHTIFMCSACG